ncbi:uncharacterized protein TRIADDRAFT_4592, partial [Trichoplax adhaerens]
VIFAVNCGGSAHTDLNGVHYQADYNTVGINSDHGLQLSINRVPTPDQILYQTERYHSETFSYDIPIKEDDDYVLILKFSEVYFTGSNMKVFDVRLNSKHEVIKGLDIYHKVGKGTAHDEYIPFKISHKSLLINDESSPFKGVLTVEFIKGHLDNPKVNAIVVMKGQVSDVPKLAPLAGAEEADKDFDDDDDTSDTNSNTDNTQTPHSRKLSGPPVVNPYAVDDGSSYVVPIAVAVGVFIPTVFFLCRL